MPTPTHCGAGFPGPPTEAAVSLASISLFLPVGDKPWSLGAGGWFRNLDSGQVWLGMLWEGTTDARRACGAASQLENCPRGADGERGGTVKTNAAQGTG